MLWPYVHLCHVWKRVPLFFEANKGTAIAIQSHAESRSTAAKRSKRHRRRSWLKMEHEELAARHFLPDDDDVDQGFLAELSLLSDDFCPRPTKDSSLTALVSPTQHYIHPCVCVCVCLCGASKTIFCPHFRHLTSDCVTRDIFWNSSVVIRLSFGGHSNIRV